MVFHSTHLLLNSKSGFAWRNGIVKFYVIYGFVMLILTTIAMAANQLMGQFMWIEHRNFPGGPFSYYLENSTLWINVLGTAACIVGNYLNDALLLYRLYIIYSGDWRVVIAPFIIFLGTIAMSLMALTESALPNSSFFEKTTTDFTVPWLALTCGLNAIVTILISGRIIYYTRLASANGTSSRSSHTSIVAILVESALPFTILGILCAVYFGKQEAPELAFAVVWGSFVPISPQLIILRVALGRAWTKETSKKLSVLSSDLQFAERVTADTEGSYIYGRSGSKNTFSESDEAV